MESVSYLKNLKVSPKKLRFLLSSVRKQRPSRALELLMYMPKKSAKVLYQAIKSAITNAKNTLKVGDDLLRFKVLAVDEGNKLKRFQPGGRGTAKPYVKRFSHIKIILEVKEKEKEDRSSKLKTQNSKLKLKSKNLSTNKKIGIRK